MAAQCEQLPPPNLDPAPSNECPFLGDFLGLLLLTGECVGCPPGPPRWVRAGLGGPDEEEDDDAAAVWGAVGPRVETLEGNLAVRTGLLEPTYGLKLNKMSLETGGRKDYFWL